MKKHRRESAGVSYFTGNCVAFPVKQKALRGMLHSAKCTNVNPRCLRCGRLYATFGLSKHWKIIAVAIAVIILWNIIIILLLPSPFALGMHLQRFCFKQLLFPHTML